MELLATLSVSAVQAVLLNGELDVDIVAVSVFAVTRVGLEPFALAGARFKLERGRCALLWLC